MEVISKMTLKVHNERVIEGAGDSKIQRLNRLIKETDWEFSTLGMIVYWKRANKDSDYFFSWNMYLDGNHSSSSEDRILIDIHLWIKD